MARKSNTDQKSSEDKNIESPVALTGHTHTAAVVEDEQTGKVQAAHQTTVVTDPESDEAVQIPEEADARSADPLSVHKQPTPNEVFAGDAEPVESDQLETPADNSDND